ncbi:MAG TPA: hypothetical protein VNZ86_00895 [Bacteroidia bacterium]|nr:hypothetical protein [Bacteroidia bacterium]
MRQEKVFTYTFLTMVIHPSKQVVIAPGSALWSKQMMVNSRVDSAEMISFIEEVRKEMRELSKQMFSLVEKRKKTVQPYKLPHL